MSLEGPYFVIDPDEGKRAGKKRRGSAGKKRPGAQLNAKATPKDGYMPGAKTLTTSELSGYENTRKVLRRTHASPSMLLAAASPFVTDAGLGTAGPLVGLDWASDAPFHFSPWDLYLEGKAQSTNLLIIGGIGAGKSGTCKLMVLRSLAYGIQAVIPNDIKGEWLQVAERSGGQVITLGAGGAERINPLDSQPQRDGSTAAEHARLTLARRQATLVSFANALMSGRQLTPSEIYLLNVALERAIAETGDRPTIRHLYGILRDPSKLPAEYQRRFQEDGKELVPIFDRLVHGDLSGLFEDDSTVKFDHNAPIVVVNTSHLQTHSEDAFRLAQIATTNWVQAVISNKTSGRRRFIIREEGWSDMRSIQALRVFQTWMKLSRDFGISNVVILHKVSDFDAVGPEGSEERATAMSILRDIENRFVFRQAPGERRRLVTDLGFSPELAEGTMGLGKGVFLAQIGAHRLLQVNSFVTTDKQWELPLVLTDAAMHAGSSVFEEEETQPSVPAPLWFPPNEQDSVEQVDVRIDCECGMRNDPEARFCEHCGAPLMGAW